MVVRENIRLTFNRRYCPVAPFTSATVSADGTLDDKSSSLEIVDLDVPRAYYNMA